MKFFLIALAIFLLSSSVAFADSSVISNLSVTVVTPSPSITTSPTETPSLQNSSGGGEGSIALPVVPQPASVQLNGVAYPDARVVLLRDGSIIGETHADSNGSFSLSITGLSGGTYNFGFWAEDGSKKRSVTFSFQLVVTSDSTTIVSGILLPPTIILGNTSLAVGEPLRISGFAPVGSSVIIQSNPGNRSATVRVGNNGFYSFEMPMNDIARGTYIAKAKSHFSDILESTFSQLVAFSINSLLRENSCGASSDMNKDGNVDLVDFSIMAYWWNREFTPNVRVDLNCDGNLTISDFSILAYHWTGS